MKEKILLIDDDLLVLRSISNLLRNASFEVDAVSKGYEAIQKVEKSHYDLIVSDIRMPGERGIEIVSRIKDLAKSRRMGNIPFLFITGYASEDVPIEAIQMGADDYILKPFDNEQFLFSVRKAISRSRELGKVNLTKFYNSITQLKSLIERYEEDHEEAIFENKTLKVFIDGLNKINNDLQRIMIGQEENGYDKG